MCLVFIASVVHRYWRGGTPVQSGPGASPPPDLIIDLREESIENPIEVEVLNGCGMQGLGQQFTDFLRSHQIDVVKTENADHFQYEKTVIIQRNQYVESSYFIADILKIPKNDTTRILIQPDLSLETDVTLIVGKDYANIKPFQDYLSKHPQL